MHKLEVASGVAHFLILRTAMVENVVGLRLCNPLLVRNFFDLLLHSPRKDTTLRPLWGLAHTTRETSYSTKRTRTRTKTVPKELFLCHNTLNTLRKKNKKILAGLKYYAAKTSLCRLLVIKVRENIVGLFARKAPQEGLPRRSTSISFTRSSFCAHHHLLT